MFRNKLPKRMSLKLLLKRTHVAEAAAEAPAAAEVNAESVAAAAFTYDVCFAVHCASSSIISAALRQQLQRRPALRQQLQRRHAI